MQFLAARQSTYQFLFADREILPIDSEEKVNAFFEQHAIDYCVNCAAYTAVDKAESETELANAINGDGPGYLAAACKAAGAKLIHISTDYVFDGTADAPYQIDHPVSPVNAYGGSKLLGEEKVQSILPSAIIIRTSWVYSSFGNNFVKTMLRLMKDRPALNVVADQIGCPTYAADLAEAILHLIEYQQLHPDQTGRQGGLYHYSNTGVISWFDFATAIAQLSGSTCVVSPIPSSQYPTPAKRPAYSVMDTSKIQQEFDLQIPAWKDSLVKCLQLLS